MTNYKRIISYIYMYENGERIRNVGFAKIDGRSQMYKLVISLKTPQDYAAEILNVNLFKESNGKFIGINIGNFRPINESCEFKTVVAQTDINQTGVEFGDICGIYISGSEKDKYYFVCQWENDGFQESEFVMIDEYIEEDSVTVETEIQPIPEEMKPEEVVAVEETEEEPIEEIIEEVKSSPKKMEESEVIIGYQQTNTGFTKDSLIEELETYVYNEVKERDEQVKEASVMENNRGAWEQITSQRTKINSRVLGSRSECIKIRPSDLAILPKQYHPLGKNSFLLHGYYNYKYIILAKLGDDGANSRIILGVPGLYQKNEKMMAGMFGFDDFIQLSSDVPGNRYQNMAHNIGYWCMELKL